MSALRQLDYIAGELREPGGDLGVWLCDPSTAERIALQAATDSPAVEEAIAAADRASAEGTWAGLTAQERADQLDLIGAALDARTDQIAEAEGVCTGLVAPIAAAFAGSLGESFRDAAKMIREQVNPQMLGEPDRPVELWRLPWGPTAVLVPWNAAGAMAAKKTAYALAAGNTVLLKPPEWSPFSCTLLAEAIDEVGLPPGVFQLVHGGPDIGRQVTGDPRVRAIAYTGSVKAGMEIASRAAANFAALQLELGGNNPVIVRADADLELAAQALASGMTKLNGQWCEGPGKIYVAEERHDELIAALQRALAAVSIGPHTSETAAMGPLAHASHRDQLQAQVDALVDMGGTELAVGDVPSAGWFWAPRLVVGAPMEACIDEMFGPVVTIHPYADEVQAVADANSSPYGLAAYVFGSDVDAAMATGRALRFGEVKINGTSLLDMSDRSAQSFWRSSGIGGHGNRELLAFFQGTQIVGLDRPGLPI